MQIPSNYRVCFLSNCPMSSTCMRYIAGMTILPELKDGMAVYPNALKEDGTCAYYREFRSVSFAYGFRKLLGLVKYNETKYMRERIKRFLGGHGTYYRFHNGIKMLTPKQQESILNIFRRCGYNEDLEFDTYVLKHDFSE